MSIDESELKKFTEFLFAHDELDSLEEAVAAYRNSRQQVTKPAFSVADFDLELESLMFDGPSLPEGFSRADIYSDHD